ncbi:DUF3304 domain-containing protein [Deefgea rivuli]|uniref:DUF3304 domain-containing protein n=1 Tax=Deefgea rivuli TaxID=400948 RepID=UPI0004881E0F|nr:DUF3304 domain-containing protein [Deefgea rivuli]
MNMFSLRAVCLVPILIVLSACSATPKIQYTGVPTEVVQTDTKIRITDASFNGEGLSAGGGQTCCVRIPAQWQAGQTAEITWTVDPSPGLNPGGVKKPAYNANGTSNDKVDDWYRIHEAQYTQHKKTIALPKYQEICLVKVIFLPCNDVTTIIDCNELNRIENNLPTGGPNRKVEWIRAAGGDLSCLKR